MTLTYCSASLPISIVIFDVTGITSDLLRRAFSKQPGYNVVGCPKSIEETLRVVIEREPDIAVISAFERSGSVTAIELLDQLSLIGSAAHAVILSANLTNEETVAYFRAQARASEVTSLKVMVKPGVMTAVVLTVGTVPAVAAAPVSVKEFVVVA
jgi:DNA-binding NarL/FixJ family response regulator